MKVLKFLGIHPRLMVKFDLHMSSVKKLTERSLLDALRSWTPKGSSENRMKKNQKNRFRSYFVYSP